MRCRCTGVAYFCNRLYNKVIVSKACVNSSVCRRRTIIGVKVLSERNFQEEGKKALIDEIIGYTYEFGYLMDEIFNENEKLSKYKLTAKQSRIIKILSKNDLTLNALAQKIESTPSSLSQIISKMEKNRYIKRVVNTDDRREIIVTLGPKGSEYISELYNFYKKSANVYINELSDSELELMREFYKKIIGLSKPYLRKQ